MYRRAWARWGPRLGSRPAPPYQQCQDQGLQQKYIKNWKRKKMLQSKT